LVTGYPIGTGTYRAFENYANLGFYKSLYYIHSINSSNLPISEKPLYRNIRPNILSPKLAYVSSFYFGRALKRIIKGDYIHVLEPGFFHLSKFDIQAIGTVHDIYPLVPKTAYDYSYLYKYFYKKDMSFLYNLIGVTTISNNTSNELNRLYPNVKTTTIHHWTPNYFVPLDKNSCREYLNLPRSKIILLNVASNSNNKNIEFLGEVMDLLDDNFLLIYLGNGDVHNIHKNRVKKIDRFLDNDTLVKLYNSANIYLAPSTSEGFNHPVTEAVNCGVPVIASKIPVFEEILFNSPYLMPLDKEIWANEIVSLYDKQNAREARSWYEDNIGDYYREKRGKEEFQNFFESLGII
jgi:glycosyltransferase involved in cell wall biosynthesis